MIWRVKIFACRARPLRWERVARGGGERTALGGSAIFQHYFEEQVTERKSGRTRNQEHGDVHENVFKKAHLSSVLVFEVIDWLGRNLGAVFEPSIKLLDRLIKPGLTLR